MGWTTKCVGGDLMAITLERPAFYENKRYAEYCGLSTDNKADIKKENKDNK